MNTAPEKSSDDLEMQLERFTTGTVEAIKEQNCHGKLQHNKQLNKQTVGNPTTSIDYPRDKRTKKIHCLRNFRSSFHLENRFE